MRTPSAAWLADAINISGRIFFSMGYLVDCSC
jgi:hypothetical protein